MHMMDLTADERQRRYRAKRRLTEQRVALWFTKEQLALIDDARGAVDRESWLREAALRLLRQQRGHDALAAVSWDDLAAMPTTD
jgi:hypothetical protein